MQVRQRTLTERYSKWVVVYSKLLTGGGTYGE